MNFIENIYNRLRVSKKWEARKTESLYCLKQLLKSDAVYEQLSKEGYAVIPFLNAEELIPLQQNLQTFSSFRNNKGSSLFYTSGRDESDIRKIAKELSWPHVKDYIGRFINTENTHVEGCAWLLKPPGDEGGAKSPSRQFAGG